MYHGLTISTQIIPGAGWNQRGIDCGLDSCGNWIHLTPPLNNIDAANMAIYEHIRQQQMKVLMRDAKQQTD